MHSRLPFMAFKTALLFILSTMMIACQDTIPNRTTITPQEPITTGGSDGGGDDDKTIVRPTNAVKFKLDFCGCKDTKAVTYGSCTNTCLNKNTNGAEVLYANFNVTEDISLNPDLGNLAGWCNTPIEGEEANPKCVIEAKDENDNKIIVDVVPNGNTLTANIDSLSEDITYVLTLIETTSGAKSDSVQIIKYSPDISNPVLGPLKNVPVSQYTCIYRPSVIDDSNGDVFYDQAFRTHFYFVPAVPPQPIPPGTDLICHDIFNPLYGVIDDILYPRLELIKGVFNLWDVNDPRFYDLNENGNLDVNDIIIQKTKNFGATIPASSRFFEKFPVMTTVEQNDDAGNNSSAQSMGYYMAPWIDAISKRSYCLNSSHYNGSNPLFKAMRDVIGVDLEGIYVGVKPPESVQDRDGNYVTGPSDFILIRETDLKKVWFYLSESNVPTAPTDAIVSSKAVFFYYPLNFDAPYVKSSSQRIYQVKGAGELSGQSVSDEGTTSTGGKTDFPPHDRKIGCVPKF